ncbi:MAG: sugar ABC transporter permease [Rhodothermales bacterium]
MARSTPYLLLLPALALTALILAFPLLQNVLNSVQDLSMTSEAGTWNGLGNYAKIFDDDVFWLSARNTFFYALLGTLLSLAIGLAFAVLLNLKVGRFGGIAEVLYTIPWVVSPVVAGFAWKWMLNDHFGIVNYWLQKIGLIDDGITWLGNPQTALGCVIVARVWQFYPFAMVMFLAALQSIPPAQYEAADVDGASIWQRFRFVTLPNLAAVTSILIPLGMIWSFNDFNMVFVMTRGGPINASMVLPVLVREYAFVEFDLGKSSALSIVIFVVLVALSLAYLRIVRRRDES